ncbi:hypothetical protein BSR28_05785 [Boudabousia liubingyangii]|uniref:DUF2797 domain-containing protein n=1 Tax=Boudabousia liubingyangii TaxID=1921764 RepID=UPI00093E1DCF|nr:DUF2797 domain-containing protein [Boudabousia liubingyangii]OKL46933.1 hypothetical protein BSR28_05785 [Boudabousia liubingyangii]
MLAYLLKTYANNGQMVLRFRLLDQDGQPLPAVEDPANPLPETSKTARYLDVHPGQQLQVKPTGQRRCVGHSRLQPDGTFLYVPCRTARVIDKSTQCFPCRRADQSMLIHRTPRERASEALVKYLDVPHFLYVATFADGTSKVGTSRSLRGMNRWVEQGAVMAQRLGEYPDGWAVRQAEDAVSGGCALTQQVRSSRKAASYVAGTALEVEELEDVCVDAARQALQVLDPLGLRGDEADGPGSFLGSPWQNEVALDYLQEGFLANPQVPQGRVDLKKQGGPWHLQQLVGTTGFLTPGGAGASADAGASVPAEGPVSAADFGALKAIEVELDVL